MKPVFSRLSRPIAIWGLILTLVACSPIESTRGPISPSESSPGASSTQSSNRKSTNDQSTSTSKGATRPSKGPKGSKGSTTPPKASKRATGPSAGSVDGIVVKVVDGDTVHVLLDSGERVKVRVLGIDTPEIAHNPTEKTQCFGRKATKQMRKLVGDKRVKLISDKHSDDVDVYGRLLRYVEVDGVDVGRELIKQGLAHIYAPEKPKDAKRVKELARYKSYRKAETKAKARKHGGWGGCGW